MTLGKQREKNRLRQLKGIALNASNRIIGKIVRNHLGIKDRKYCILVTTSPNKNGVGFRACLTPNEASGENVCWGKLPIIHSIRNVEILNEGDIVSLDMDSGEIIVLYEKSSIHNSILASTDCNCRCIMCPQVLAPNCRENLKNNIELIELIDKETTALAITGGEPTLLKDDLINLLRHCKERLPSTQIDILTNGILLKDSEYVRKIAKLGMKKLVFCIPLYADTDTEHDYVMQRKGAFEDAIQGLYNLASMKQSIEIRVVVISHNHKRLPQIAAFIYHNLPFAIHVAFMGMEVEGTASRNIRKLWASPRAYGPYLEDAVVYLNQRNMSVSIYNEQLCLMPKKIWGFMRKSISDWKNTYIEECTDCIGKNDCGGFFAEPFEEHKKLINAL
jgi:His-Xaa-Ser system radical SAM maturase HxsC